MAITFENLVALLPLMIVGITVTGVMLLVAWLRNLKQTTCFSIIGLLLALVSLFCATDAGIQQITPLLISDKYTLFYTALILITSIATILFAHPWLKEYPDNKEEFHLMVLIATLGGIVLSGATHFASLFIGLELLTLPMFGLIGYAYRQKHSIEAAMKYMLLSSMASSFLLFGIALFYAATGTLTFASVETHLLSNTVPQLILWLGIGLMLVGFAFKLSLVPFQLWTPDVYQGAPATVTLYLATVGKIAVFCVLARLLFSFSAIDKASISVALGVLAFLSMLVGNLLALKENNLKRMLGYSSVAHLGYLLVILVALSGSKVSGSEASFFAEAIAVYSVGYLLASFIAFGTIIHLSVPYTDSGDAEMIESYRGLFWRQPIFAFSLTIAMLSLAGVPLTLGFIGKFYLVVVGADAHLWWLIAALILGSAMGLYYYLKVVFILFQKSSTSTLASVPCSLSTKSTTFVILLSACLLLLFGVLPNLLIEIAATAIPK